MYASNMILIEQIPVMSDNYIYILVDKSTNQTACVDPGVTSEVINYIDENIKGSLGIMLDDIMEGIYAILIMSLVLYFLGGW